MLMANSFIFQIRSLHSLSLSGWVSKIYNFYLGLLIGGLMKSMFSSICTATITPPLRVDDRRSWCSPSCVLRPPGGVPREALRRWRRVRQGLQQRHRPPGDVYGSHRSSQRAEERAGRHVLLLSLVSPSLSRSIDRRCLF